MSQPHLARGRSPKPGPVSVASLKSGALSGGFAPAASSTTTQANGLLTAALSSTPKLTTPDAIWEDLCRTLREL